MCKKFINIIVIITFLAGAVNTPAAGSAPVSRNSLAPETMLKGTSGEQAKELLEAKRDLKRRKRTKEFDFLLDRQFPFLAGFGYESIPVKRTVYAAIPARAPYSFKEIISGKVRLDGSIAVEKRSVKRFWGRHKEILLKRLLRAMRRNAIVAYRGVLKEVRFKIVEKHTALISTRYTPEGVYEIIIDAGLFDLEKSIETTVETEETAELIKLIQRYPEKFRYDRPSKSLIVKGVMSRRMREDMEAACGKSAANELFLKSRFNIYPVLLLVLQHQLYGPRLREELGGKGYDPLIMEMSMLISDRAVFSKMKPFEKRAVKNAFELLEEGGYDAMPYIRYLESPAKDLKEEIRSAYELAVNKKVNPLLYRRVKQLEKHSTVLDKKRVYIRFGQAIEKYPFKKLPRGYKPRGMAEYTNLLEKIFEKPLSIFKNVTLPRLFSVFDPSKVVAEERQIDAVMEMSAIGGEEVRKKLEEILTTADYGMKLKIAAAKVLLSMSSYKSLPMIRNPFFGREIISYLRNIREKGLIVTLGEDRFNDISFKIMLLGNIRITSPDLYREIRAELAWWTLYSKDVIEGRWLQYAAGRRAPPGQFANAAELQWICRRSMANLRTRLHEYLGAARVPENLWIKKITYNFGPKDPIIVPRNTTPEELADALELSKACGEITEAIQTALSDPFFVRESVFVIHGVSLRQADIKKIDFKYFAMGSRKINYEVMVQTKRGEIYKFLINAVNPSILTMWTAVDDATLNLTDNEKLYLMIIGRPNVEILGTEMTRGKIVMWAEELYEGNTWDDYMKQLWRQYLISRGKDAEADFAALWRDIVRMHANIQFQLYLKSGGRLVIRDPHGENSTWMTDENGEMIGRINDIGDIMVDPNPGKYIGFIYRDSLDFEKMFDVLEEKTEINDICDGVLDALGEVDGKKLLSGIAAGMSAADAETSFIADGSVFVKSRIDGYLKKEGIGYLPAQLKKPKTKEEEEFFDKMPLAQANMKFYVIRGFYRENLIKQSPWIWAHINLQELKKRGEDDPVYRGCKEVCEKIRLEKNPERFKSPREAAGLADDVAENLKLSAGERAELRNAVSYPHTLSAIVENLLAGALSKTSLKGSDYDRMKTLLRDLAVKISINPVSGAAFLDNKILNNRPVREIFARHNIPDDAPFIIRTFVLPLIYPMAEDGLIPKENLLHFFRLVPPRVIASIQPHYKKLFIDILEDLLNNDYKRFADVLNVIDEKGLNEVIVAVSFFIISGKGRTKEVTGYIFRELKPGVIRKIMETLAVTTRGDDRFWELWIGQRRDMPNSFTDNVMPGMISSVNELALIDFEKAVDMMTGLFMGLERDFEIKESFIGEDEVVTKDGRRMNDLLEFMSRVPPILQLNALGSVYNKEPERIRTFLNMLELAGLTAERKNIVGVMSAEGRLKKIADEKVEAPSVLAKKEGEYPGRIGKRARIESVVRRVIKIKDSKGEIHERKLRGPLTLDYNALKSKLMAEGKLQEELPDGTKFQGIISNLLSTYAEVAREDKLQFWEYDGLVEDLVADASSENRDIIVNSDFSDDPLVIFHEILEYLAKEGSVRFSLQMNPVKSLFSRIFPGLSGDLVIEHRKGKSAGGGYREFRRFPISGRALSIAQKDSSDPHYLIRAFVHALYENPDLLLSKKIEEAQVAGSSTAPPVAVPKTAQSLLKTLGMIGLQPTVAVSLPVKEVTGRAERRREDTSRTFWPFAKKALAVFFIGWLGGSYVSDYTKEKKLRSEVGSVLMEVPLSVNSKTNLNKYIPAMLRLGPPVVPLLVEHLGHINENVRYIASKSLEKFGPAAVKQVGEALLANARAQVRSGAAEILEKIKDPLAVDYLIRASEDSDPQVRVRVIKALASHRSEKARGVLQKAAYGPNNVICKIALLGLMDINNKQSLPVFDYILLYSDDSDLRQVAALALGKMALPESFKTMKEGYLHEKDETTRRYIISSLGSIKNPEASDLLDLAQNSDLSESVRYTAAFALGERKDKRGIQKLLKIALEQKGNELGLRAVRLLSGFRDDESIERFIKLLEVGEQEIKILGLRILLGIGPEAKPLMRKMLAHRSRAVRSGVCAVLRDMHDIEASPLMREMLLKDDDPMVRALAATYFQAVHDPESADVLMQALKDNDPKVRALAMKALSRLDEKKTVPLVHKLMKNDPSIEVKRYCVEALGEMNDVSSVDLVCSVLRAEKDLDLRLRCINTLVELRDQKGVKAILEILNRDPEMKMRFSAAFALYKLGDAKYVTELIKALDDKDPKLFLVTTLALGKLKDRRAVKPLLELLKKGQSDAGMKFTLLALGEICDPDSVEPLLGYLKDPDPGKRYFVVKALAGLTSQREVCAAIVGVLKNDSSELVREIAAEVLQRARDRESVIALCGAAENDPSSEVRARAILSLDGLKEKEVISILVRAMKDADETVRFMAAYVLGDTKDPSSMPQLIDLLADNEMTIRDFAAKALTRFLLDPAFKEHHQKLMISLYEYLSNDVGDNILLDLSPIQEMPLVISNLVCRSDEIRAKTLSVEDFIKIYTNPDFLELTKELNPYDQYAAARGIELMCRRFHVPVDGQRIKAAVPYILRAFKRDSGRILLGKGRSLIVGMHSEGVFDPDELILLARMTGIKDTKIFKMSFWKDELLNAVADAPIDTTIWLSGHGSEKYFWMDKNIGEADETLIGVPILREAINFNELYRALLRRSQETAGSLSDLDMIVDACYSADFSIFVLNQFLNDLIGGKLKDLPFVITATNRGVVGYKRKFINNIKQVMEGKDTLTVEDVRRAEKGAMIAEDYAFFSSITPDELKQLKKDLNVTVSERVEGFLDPDLPVIDNYVPIVQPGAVKEEGERIGTGLIFDADIQPEKMIPLLGARGVKIPPDFKKTVTLMQRYFNFIHIRAPDQTVSLAGLKLEFRRNVRHYMAIGGDTIYLDVKLLGLPPENILPFLSFVLSHELSHRLPWVGRNEELARSLDVKRFQASSRRHRKSIIGSLEQLDADPSYIGGLRGQLPPAPRSSTPALDQEKYLSSSFDSAA